ncbi:phage protease [Nannocystis pusilla]|uniref:phage protease n=1 Tax=Nannocystis pusilla TaxID=889268 RepID=UPI0023EE5383|nr:phage protease [Nannocystis pusilla]
MRVRPDHGDERRAEWVNIIPLADNEGRIHARDGREFILDDAAAFVRASNAAISKTGPQPVDKDHEMQSWWKPGGPALGWAEKYELRPDGVYAKTEWLPDGEQLVTSRKYRYTSSVVRCELVNIERDKYGFMESYELQMKELAGFTITNIPALEVSAMFSSQTKRTPMDITALLALVGLPPNATKEEFFAAAQAKLTAEGSSSVELAEAKTKLAEAEAKLAKAEATITKLTSDAAAAEQEALLSKALEDGKIFPSQVEYYRSQIQKPGGLADFKKFAETAPVLVSGKTKGKKVETTSNAAHGLTERQLQICRDMGIKPEDYAANIKPQES